MKKIYKIKDGVIFRPYGANSRLTNENLTDEIAQLFIKKNPSLLGSVFEKIENEIQNKNVEIETVKTEKQQKTKSKKSKLKTKN